MSQAATRFKPLEPQSLFEAGLTDGEVEALVLKYLMADPHSTGRQVARSLGLPDPLVRELLDTLRGRKAVAYTKASAFGDFEFELTESGRATARDLQKSNRYAGHAPVSMEQYIESVRHQSVSLVRPGPEALKAAFSDLLINDAMLQRLGPAITAGKGCFFFGPPGNGKTSLAERLTRAYGTAVYIPYAVKFGGQLIKVFDPVTHIPVDKRDARVAAGDDKMDGRWVLCKRPTVIVGGELTLAELELAYDEYSGVCEAPIQMKANCGTLVVDDFGRQTITPAQLLNRWIVPMEKRVDYLTVPGGRKMEVPFDPMLVFSTNLEPRNLVDDAFLRRIPYKIHIQDPDLPTFHQLFDRMARSLEIKVDPAAFDHLVSEHYAEGGRPMRMCHPRDLLLQVKNICIFRSLPHVATPALLDEAVDLYFSVV
jgi:hypothetical protein